MASPRVSRARPRSARPERIGLSLPAELLDALAAALGARPVGVRTVGGGDINDAYLVDYGDGGHAFVKTRVDADPQEFAAEAAGLRWLGEGEIPVPDVLAVGAEPAFLALEFVQPGSLSAEGAERFGRGLARLHALGAPAHGWLPGSPSRQRIGSLALSTTASEGWPEFYASQRLLPLAGMARDRGALGAEAASAIERVCERIADLAGPSEPPARLHGDLWAGNVHADPAGNAWLIDPSAQGGHRELDLAMLRLFGAPGGERVFGAYEEQAPLADGHEERVELWQLQPLLVHAVLFDGHYGAEAGRIAAQYA